ncbi:MAG: hypothetical protein ACI9FN_001113 [Saprospiraceae bacterium]|jgi:uncharacterized protein (DUF1501 family)
MNRRRFLKSSSCAAMGSATMLNTLTNLGALNGAVGSDSSINAAGNYKALVCVLLSGGIDSYNVLIPTGQGEGGDIGYLHYDGIRTDLAIDHNQILQFSNPNIQNHKDFVTPYAGFGVHPGMSEVKELFDDGNLAFLSNVGTLVEPLNNYADFQNSEKKRPLGIYSHSDQQMQWQTSVPQSRVALGVGGRMADLLYAQNEFQTVSMNISLDGKNRFQVGKDVVEYAISNNLNSNNVGFEAIDTYGKGGSLTDLRNNAIDDMVSHTYQNLLQQTLGGMSKNAIESFELFKQALEKAPSTTTTFSDNNLSEDFAAIAKVISVHEELGAKRQIFFLDFGGWDMHDNLLGGQAQRLPIVSAALKEFYAALTELGFQDNVTTFTISDFARTITSNGQGSDHAWGGNQMVMGGAVKGGTIYGAYPNMNIYENPMNVSFRGNFIPAISTDEMYAELALWYGISPVDLCYVLPNLGNFYSYSQNNYPVGFMDFVGTEICTNNHPLDCLSY